MSRKPTINKYFKRKRKGRLNEKLLLEIVLFKRKEN
jgi:hypothetical protein